MKRLFVKLINGDVDNITNISPSTINFNNECGISWTEDVVDTPDVTLPDFTTHPDFMEDSHYYGLKFYLHIAKTGTYSIPLTAEETEIARTLILQKFILFQRKKLVALLSDTPTDAPTPEEAFSAEQENLVND